MNRILIYGIKFIGLSILVSSCYTVSTIETDVLKPAKDSFPSEIYRVGVVSRMDLENKDPGIRTDKQKQIAFQRDSMFLKNAVLGLLDGLAESPRFEAYNISPKTRILQGYQLSLGNQLPWDIVDKISKKDELDLLFVLATANFTDTVQRPRELIKDKDEKEFEEDLLNTRMKAYIMFPNTYWRMYNLRSREVSEYIHRDTLIIEPWPVNGYPPRETLVKIFHDALGDMSYEYSKTVAPYWVTEGRAWYISGNGDFRRAAKLANNGSWVEAGEIWRELAYSQDKKVASRASFNLALASEMLDRPDLALEWARRSEELGLNYYPKHYIEILEKRLKEKLLLDIQMN